MLMVSKSHQPFNRGPSCLVSRVCTMTSSVGGNLLMLLFFLTMIHVSAAHMYDTSGCHQRSSFQPPFLIVGANPGRLDPFHILPLYDYQDVT